MRYKRIPGTDLDVSVIALGTWVFGGDNWGPSSEKESMEAIRAAIACGINFIDTAPVYGWGRSESIVGKAIKGRRDKVVIATKCGLAGEGKNIKINLKKDSIRKEAELSLKRLGVDHIDIYQCHWPDPRTPIEETMTEMSRLKQEGKIKHIGVSNFDLNQLKDALNFAGINTIQSHYSLLERSIEKNIMPFCREKGIGILSYGSLGGGILSGKYERQPSFHKADARSFFYGFYKGEEFKKAMEAVEVLKRISIEIKRPLSQIALNWINQKEAVVSAIVGCRNARQMHVNAFSGEWELGRQEMEQLDLVKV